MRLLNRCISTLVITLLFTVSVAAQTNCNASLSGRVIDEHDGSALFYATVYIKELERGVASDSNGNYRIEDLCEGTYTVQCSHVGCETITTQLEIKGATAHNFTPEHHAKELSAATVVGTKDRDEVRLVCPTEIIRLEEVQLTGTPLGEQLKQVNGMTTLSTGNSIAKPVLHGMHSNRLLILNNGVRLEGQQWGTEHGPEIDPFTAAEFRVITGANSVRYGPDAIAGVIQINPRPLRATPGWDGAVELAGFSNGRQGVVSARLDGQVKQLPGLSWRGQGTYKRGGNVETPNYFLKNTGSEELDFSWAARYQANQWNVEAYYSQFNTKLGVFSAAHIGNLSDLQRAFEADEPLESSEFSYDIARPWQEVEHELFKVKSTLQQGENGNLSITYARQYNRRLEYDKDEPLNDSLAALNLPELELKLTTHTGDVVWEHQWQKHLRGEMGFSALYQENTYDGRLFIPNFEKYGAGLFLLERWQSDSSRWSFGAGARLDYITQEVYLRKGNNIVSPDYSYVQPSGNLGAEYTVNERIQVVANLGTAWRPPNVSELYSNGLHHGAASVEFGDTSLVAETAYSLSLGAGYTHKKVYVRLDGYYTYFDNFIFLKPTLPPTLTIRGAFPTFRYEQVQAVLRGVDATVRLPLNNQFTLESKASLLRAWNQSTSEYLILMPADRVESSLKFVLPGKLGNGFNFISLTGERVFKQSRVPANSDFVAPPKGYNLVHFYAGFYFGAEEARMQCGLTVTNLFNTTYRDYLNRFRYYADDMGRNISLKLLIPFTFLTNHEND